MEKAFLEMLIQGIKEAVTTRSITTSEFIDKFLSDLPSELTGETTGKKLEQFLTDMESFGIREIKLDGCTIVIE